MKTLDEVIEACEKCYGKYIDCDDCTYTEINADGVTICAKDQLEDDTLNYLKKYRDNFEARNDQIERYQKAAKDCEEILTDYVALKQYWAEQQANNPLT